MSYILDALNKADSERERQRSAVPGLQSYGDTERAGSGGNAWRWIALGAIVVLVVVLAWQWFAAPGEPAPAVAAAMPAPQTMPQAMPQPLPMPTPPAALPAPSPRAAVPPPPLPAPIAPERELVRPPPVAKSVPAPKPAASASTAGASASARLPTRNELAPELRAALPPISVSGAVYAPTPKDRLLFANGAVLKEGDALAEGLIVERIGATSSVLAFRGTRFELKH